MRAKFSGVNPKWLGPRSETGKGKSLSCVYVLHTTWNWKVSPRSRARTAKKYRKIPKISPGAYIFQRLIFGRAYLWREICVSKSSGLALQLEGNLPFLLCFTLYLRGISEYKPPGGLYMEGRFNGRFFALQVWGAYIWRGLYMEGRIFGILRY